MSKKSDLLSLIPSADVVRQSLRDARQRVAKLERLLVAAEAVESRPNDDDGAIPTSTPKRREVAR